MTNLKRYFIVILSIYFIFNTLKINALSSMQYHNENQPPKIDTPIEYFIKFLKSEEGIYYLKKIGLIKPTIGFNYKQNVTIPSPEEETKEITLLCQHIEEKLTRISIDTELLIKLIEYLKYNYWLYNSIETITHSYHEIDQLTRGCINLMYNQITEEIYDEILKSANMENTQNRFSHFFKRILCYEYTSLFDKKINILKEFIETILAQT